MNDELKKRIDDMVHSKKVFLFMKGSPSFPQCGFSAKVVDILHQLHVDFGSFNILSDEAIRQGVKEYGNWPTIPQLYIDGKLVGGCDIATEMFQSGELQKLVNEKKK